MPLFCFSGGMMVKLVDSTVVSLQNVNIGDVVKVDVDRYELIYIFGHRDENSKGDCLEIKIVGRCAPLDISADRLVFVSQGNCSNSIAASMLQVGDQLVSMNGFPATIQFNSSERSSA
jgi:hypothetical protein